jgi:hypothetical protein
MKINKTIIIIIIIMIIIKTQNKKIEEIEMINEKEIKEIKEENPTTTKPNIYFKKNQPYEKGSIIYVRKEMKEPIYSPILFNYKIKLQNVEKTKMKSRMYVIVKYEDGTYLNTWIESEYNGRERIDGCGILSYKKEISEIFVSLKLFNLKNERIEIENISMKRYFFLNNLIKDIKKIKMKRI